MQLPNDQIFIGINDDDVYRIEGNLNDGFDFKVQVNFKGFTQQLINLRLAELMQYDEEIEPSSSDPQSTISSKIESSSRDPYRQSSQVSDEGTLSELKKNSYILTEYYLIFYINKDQRRRLADGLPITFNNKQYQSIITDGQRKIICLDDDNV